MKGFPKDFFLAAAKAISVFDSLDADWVFIGAIPVAVWGRVRATTDADFAISTDFSSADDLDMRMTSAGFEKIEGPIEISGKQGEEAIKAIDISCLVPPTLEGSARCAFPAEQNSRNVGSLGNLLGR